MRITRVDVFCLGFCAALVLFSLVMAHAGCGT